MNNLPSSRQRNWLSSFPWENHLNKRNCFKIERSLNQNKDGKERDIPYFNAGRKV